MNHATQYHIGNHQNPEAPQAKSLAQTVGRVRRLDAKTKGCKGNTERQTASCTENHVADGFLKCAFLPKLQKAETLRACRNPKRTERDFYLSLSQLAEHYAIEPMQSRAYGYPYNLALAMDDMQEQLSDTVRDWEEICLVQDRGKTYFSSEERYNTGATLYYIPIIPLYLLSKNRKHRQAAQLLQSVCAYLYHIADVPYYRQESSYLYWVYEMVTEWVVYDDENGDTPTYLNEIRQAELIGEYMEQKIYNTHNLNRFKERLDRFKVKDNFDHDCFMLACEAFALYKQYPNENIYRNARPNGETEEDEMEDSVSMDKYVSFCADVNGMLFQTLFESVNTELQEYGQTEEPVIIKHFDGSNSTGNSLDFENRVFSLIEQLICLLSNF